MSRSKAMEVKTTENILKHYNAQMKHHIRKNEKVRFCLSLTPEQVGILQDALNKEFPGYVATQKRKYLWVEKTPVKEKYDNAIPDFWYDGYASAADFWDCQL